MTKILVVDDELAIVTLLAEVLEEHNYTVFKALNGKQALDICMREKPDLVISDIMMPGIDGYELSRQIKNNPQLSYIKIILMTAGFFNPAVAAGCYDEFLKKPFDIEEVETLLQKIFPVNGSPQNFNNTVSHHP